MALEDVAQVVRALDVELRGFSEAFASGQYSLWVGSAISRDVVPDLKTLMTRVLEVLRDGIDESVVDCPFRVALEEVLQVAGVPDDVRETLNFDTPVSTWAARETIVNRAIDRYSDVLNI